MFGFEVSKGFNIVSLCCKKCLESIASLRSSTQPRSFSIDVIFELARCKPTARIWPPSAFVSVIKSLARTLGGVELDISGYGFLCRPRALARLLSVFDFVIGFISRILERIRLGIRFEMLGCDFLRKSRTFVEFLSVFDFVIGFIGRILNSVGFGMSSCGFLRRSRTFVGFLSMFDFAIRLIDGVLGGVGLSTKHNFHFPSLLDTSLMKSWGELGWVPGMTSISSSSSEVRLMKSWRELDWEPGMTSTSSSLSDTRLITK